MSGVAPLRCRIGLNKRRCIDLEVKLGYGFFGGPLIIYHMVCDRCGKRWSWS